MDETKLTRIIKYGGFACLLGCFLPWNSIPASAFSNIFAGGAAFAVIVSVLAILGSVMILLGGKIDDRLILIGALLVLVGLVLNFIFVHPSFAIGLFFLLVGAIASIIAGPKLSIAKLYINPAKASKKIEVK